MNRVQKAYLVAVVWFLITLIAILLKKEQVWMVAFFAGWSTHITTYYLQETND